MLLKCGFGEDSWESLELKDIKSVHPKGNQSCIVIGRTDAEAEAPILWPPDVKNWLIGKDPDAGKDGGQEEKQVSSPSIHEMVGWHHWFNGHEFEQNPGDSEGQGSLGCCSPGVTKSWSWLSNWMTRQDKLWRLSPETQFWNDPRKGTFHIFTYLKWDAPYNWFAIL